MATNPLIEIKPGAGLETGLFPMAEPTSGPVWRTGRNAWFRQLSLSHTLGRALVINALGRTPQAMTQAFADGETRLYYEDLGLIFRWNGASDPVLIDELDEAGQFDLEPWGTWLLATDNIGNVKLWKNEAGFISIGSSQFARGKIIKKLGQRVLVYSTDVLPAGVHYCKISDPETWEPVIADVITGAGNLPFRNLDSEIIAVADLAGGHAVYTEDKMTFLQYLGETLKFGTPSAPLAGIGAASSESIISRGSRNFGLFEGGIFMTDGSSFKLLDDPALSDWLRTQVDWDRKIEIAGYYDKKLLCNVWSVPHVNGESRGVTLDEQGRFSFIDAEFNCALEQEIFNFPFVGGSAGIYKASLPNTVLGTMTVSSQLLDGGDNSRYKAWDFAIFTGTLSGQVRFGYADAPTMASVQWGDWQDLMHRVPLIPRESIYLAMEFSSTETLNISGIKIYGGVGGLVL